MHHLHTATLRYKQPHILFVLLLPQQRDPIIKSGNPSPTLSRSPPPLLSLFSVQFRGFSISSPHRHLLRIGWLPSMFSWGIGKMIAAQPYPRGNFESWIHPKKKHLLPPFQTLKFPIYTSLLFYYKVLGKQRRRLEKGIWKNCW